MTSLIIAKIFVTIFFVIGLSVIAERISPRWAGILSGYPTGTAISLFFFGLEISPQFAANSVTYNIVGLVSTFCCIYCYYQASRRWSILPSVVVALCGYAIAVSALHLIPFNKAGAVLFSLCAIVLFSYLFKSIKDSAIKKRVQLKLPVLLLRGLAAAGIVLIITGTAHAVGPVWSGLFSSFPTTLLPLILIIHFTYNAEHVHTIIKNVPIGNVAIIVYSLTIAATYPTLGIYLGTALAFVFATVYLGIYQFIRQAVKKL